MHHTVQGSQCFRLRVSTGSRWSHQENLWWPSRSVFTKPEVEHSSQTRHDVVVRQVCDIHVIKEFAECLLHALHVQLILLEALIRLVLQFWTVQLLINCQ